MTHTPGPWFAEAGNDGTFGLYARTEQFGTQLLGEFYDEDMGDPVPARENLHLAAAAPEMLLVLQRLERWFDTDQEILDAMGADELADHNRQLAAIRAAIAKARGAA